MASSGQQTESDLDVSTSTPESSTKVRSEAQEGRQNGGQMGMAVGDVQRSGWQSEQRSGTASSGSQTKGKEQGLSFMWKRPVNDVRRGQQYMVAKEREEPHKL